MFGNKRLYPFPLPSRLVDLNKGEGAGKYDKDCLEMAES
jgi:hypothetical protein